MVNTDGLTTETVNEATENINELDSLGIVTLINDEDKKVALAVEKELPNITRAVDEIAAGFKRGGQIIYYGTGSSGCTETSGAAELTSTYSVSSGRAPGLLADGETAMYKAVEGAGDSKELALEGLEGTQITKDDCIIGTAANGRTSYTISVLEYVNEVGVLSISITYSGENGTAKIVDISVAPAMGTEAVNGSIRMKVGTAQRMVVNILSTVTMIRLGKVYHSYVIQVQLTNEKLMVRTTKMIAQITGVEGDKVLVALESTGPNVSGAIIVPEGSCDREMVRKAPDQASGQIRKAIEIIKR